ncbi:GAF domain-containing sensor histidine kinase [Paracoccus sp. Z330]|uniref:histidine kinase n=1 Tax=Paracoccus onchidii TaxID=3017813 RepID=A0ABT4ZG14_9RHOB|nr:GAF domain-containing sensor histidine kinase [Paracoccus onchidii]MDB6178297.1 GAF domain-containing sensor histidine kinase [Paracoccus onchidii]
MTDLPDDLCGSELDSHETAGLALDGAFRRDVEAVLSNPSAMTMLETVCMATGLRFAAIARVTADRWVTCCAVDRLAFGLRPGDELRIDTTLCQDVEQSHQEIVIDDVLSDPAYCNHQVPRDYGFRSYLSFPVYRKDGEFFGTLCALDPEPNRLSDPRVLDMIRLFARIVGETIDARDQLNQACDGLIEERHKAEAQEQFIAILAHDLRNPLSAVDAGLRMIGRCQIDDQARQILSLIEGSTLRMRGLIDNLMDHARNRLGGGIVLSRSRVGDLAEVFDHIIAEFRTVSPDQPIEAEFSLPQNIDCDQARVAQLLSNLLGNAIKHGTPGQPVMVRAYIDDDRFNLSVTNRGAAISPDEMPMLFQPFRKSHSNPNKDGLGLGLHIASEIARAHGGRMDVHSDDNATEFRFHMPL